MGELMRGEGPAYLREELLERPACTGPAPRRVGRRSDRLSRPGTVGSLGLHGWPVSLLDDRHAMCHTTESPTQKRGHR
jgi:hypothetical protein